MLGLPAAPNRYNAKLARSKKMHISRPFKYAGMPPEQEGGQMGARAGKDSCVRGSAYALEALIYDLCFIRRYLHLPETLRPKARGV